jgi:NAD(P)-dependent dehydrogenase (short-subunit alcohol dehydrogenase family)
MAIRLQGKTAIVTGGARGIGQAVVYALLEEGANVAFCARTAASVEKALAEIGPDRKAFGAEADVRDAAGVERFVADVEAKFGGVDILVNNAGVGVFRPVAELSVEDWEQTIGTNLTGVFHFCRACLPLFRKRGGGQVVNISSLAGRNPFAAGAAYNASKFGLNGFTEAMMLDHRQENVRVSLIAPGSVDTEFSPRTAGSGDWKIAAADVAEAVLAVLTMPARTLVSLVEMRPAKPRKT